MSTLQCKSASLRLLGSRKSPKSGGGKPLLAYAAVVMLFLSAAIVPAMPSDALAAEDAPEKTYRLDIPGGPLKEALSEFSRQTGLEVRHQADSFEGLTTQGVRGEMTAREGLRALVAGTGLEASLSDDGGLTLAARSGRRGDEAVLPTMQVWGQAAGTHEVSMDKLRRSLAKDMADVFRDQPSIVVGGGARNAQRLYVRGVEATNLNVTIDGAKQGGSLHQHRGDIGSIEPNLLKKVAVQTGSTADAGPGALGGSIRFETVDAQDLLEPGRNVGAILRGGYGSVDKSWNGGGTAYGLMGDHFGILANFSGLDRRDYSVGDGDEAENTAGEDYNYMLKLSMLDLADHSLRFSAERMRSSGLYVWGGPGSDMGFSTTADPVYVHSERTSLVADHRFNPKNQYVDSRINLYYNDNLVENRDGDSEYTAETVGGDARNTFHFRFGSVENDLTSGLDYVLETDLAEVGGAETQNTSHNIGFYLQNRMSWGPVRLSFGARLDGYEAEFGENVVDGSRVSPNIGAEYDVLSFMTAFANYGQAVRASGIIPGSWMANINAGTAFDVESPETSERYEGGLRFHETGLLLPSDTAQLELTYFDSRMKNIITAQGGMGGVVNAVYNSDPLFSKGWEARLGWGIEWYDTSLGYTHITTRDEDGDPVSVSRRLAASTGDRMVWDNRFSFLETWTFGYTLTYVARLTDVADGNDERPGYVLHAVQAGWTPDFVPGLTLSLAVDNLLDRKYSEQTSIMDNAGNVAYEPGRDIRLGFEYRF